MNNTTPDKKQLVLYFCISIFIATLVITSITATKLWSLTLPFVNYMIVIPVGTSLFAFTFLATDVIAEVWGKSYSVVIVWLGFFVRILALSFFAFAVWIEPVSFWENQAAYEITLGGSFRIIIAGIIAYLVSQLNDVFVFHYFKQKDEGKNLLWKRNNLSTFTSQFLDSFLFIIIAFGGVMTIAQLISAIIGQVVIKWIIAMLDTPLVYMLRNYATNRSIFDFKG
ncbi:queuosine precursor transporter [Thiotrichales bacterium HSG1]|nr:queuosine precursor transporter [Thiotrichales bacterium HSG1]